MPCFGPSTQVDRPKFHASHDGTERLLPRNPRRRRTPGRGFAPVDDVVDEAVVDGAKGSGHEKKGWDQDCPDNGSAGVRKPRVGGLRSRNGGAMTIGGADR